MCFLPPTTPGARASSRSCSSERRAPRASACSAGATCRSTTTHVGDDGAARAAPYDPPAVRRRAGRGCRGPGRVRAQALRDPPRSCELRRRARTSTSPSFSSRTIVYKGMLICPSSRRFYPDLRDERFKTRAGARALALLDEHVPELGARPPLPRDLPQRRDQHAEGQRQLDARARVASCAASCSATTCRRSCRSCAPAARTRRRSTTCSSC